MRGPRIEMHVRTAIVERFVAGDSYDAISQALGCTVSGAKAVVNRARAAGAIIQPKHRSPFTQDEQNAVLDSWKAHAKGSEIAADLGLKSEQVNSIVTRARHAGDPRAVRRARFYQRPAEHCRRKKIAAAALREAVLTGWQEGLTGAQIAYRQRIDAEYVYAIIKKARAAGDARAARRYQA